MSEEQKQEAQSGNQTVQLGIGTLIIIALIVSMCSGHGEIKKVQSDTTELKRQVGEINRKLDELAAKAAVTGREHVAAPGDAGASPPPNP